MINKLRFKLSVLSVIYILLCLILQPVSTEASVSDYISFVILSDYDITMDIGDKFQLSAVTSTLKKPSWKSSDSKIASVSRSGVVTAKKYGTAEITARIKNAEASCKVTVNKTTITLSQVRVSVENHTSISIKAETSNGSAVKWKSSKKSVATVDENGVVKAFKPGEAVITAKADGTSAECHVTVRKPIVAISRSTAKLYRMQTLQLTASSTSSTVPKWKSNKKSVATVSDKGLVTAKKNGSATISVNIDGVIRECSITVMKPEISLNFSELTLTAGSTFQLNADVSSGNAPSFSSSNTDVAVVDANGRITARKKGKAYIYAAEDGVKVKCTVLILEK